MKLTLTARASAIIRTVTEVSSTRCNHNLKDNNPKLLKWKHLRLMIDHHTKLRCRSFYGSEDIQTKPGHADINSTPIPKKQSLLLLVLHANTKTWMLFLLLLPRSSNQRTTSCFRHELQMCPWVFCPSQCHRHGRSCCCTWKLKNRVSNYSSTCTSKTRSAIEQSVQNVSFT